MWKKTSRRAEGGGEKGEYDDKKRNADVSE